MLAVLLTYVVLFTILDAHDYGSHSLAQDNAPVRTALLSGKHDWLASHFMRFVRGSGLLKTHGSDTGPRGGEELLRAQGGRPLLAAEAELLFQRATTRGLQSRGKRWAEVQRVGSICKEDAALQIAQMYATAEGGGREGRDEEEEDDDHDRGMAPKELAGALVRLAWACLPPSPGGGGLASPEGVGARLTRLLEGVVLPALDDVVNRADPLARTLERSRVRAVLEHYESDLRPIFSSYAAADQSKPAGGSVRKAADSVNLAELTYMVNEGR